MTVKAGGGQPAVDAVDEGSNVGAGGLVLQVGPAGLGRHPEDALGGVFIPRFEQAFDLLGLHPGFGQLGLQLVAAGLEAVGDVLEEEQAEDHVLVLGGIHLPAERIGGFPERVGVGEVGGRVARHGQALLQPLPGSFLESTICPIPRRGSSCPSGEVVTTFEWIPLTLDA
jgi:hypothetical protein